MPATQSNHRRSANLPTLDSRTSNWHAKWGQVTGTRRITGICHRWQVAAAPSDADLNRVDRLQEPSEGPRLVWRGSSYAPVNHRASRDTSSSIGIGLDDAGVNRESFATDQAFAHAAPQHVFKDVVKGVALAETADRSRSYFGRSDRSARSELLSPGQAGLALWLYRPFVQDHASLHPARRYGSPGRARPDRLHSILS